MPEHVLKRVLVEMVLQIRMGEMYVVACQEQPRGRSWLSCKVSPGLTTAFKLSVTAE